MSIYKQIPSVYFYLCKEAKEDEKKKEDSGLKTALLMIVAIIFMIMAISVIVIVFGKIHSDYEKLDMTKAANRKHWKYQQLRRKETDQTGWEETEDGWKYKIDEKTYAWISGWK